MKAMILAAGLGTRLGNLTKDKPKALVEINGITLLENLIIRLKEQGIKQFIVNIHHFGEQIIEFLEKNKNFGVNIAISDERDELLDTGGAIKKASSFFKGEEPVLVHNVDVYSEFNLNELLAYHRGMGSLVTVCVRKRNSGRALIFNNKKLLVGWVNLEENYFRWVNERTEIFETYAYNGVFIAEPGFAEKIPFDGMFSIIDCWLKMAKKDEIAAYIDESPVWFDLGSEEKIKKAEQYLKRNKV